MAENAPLPEPIRKPRLSRSPSWYGGLTGPEYLFVKNAFAHPEMGWRDLGKLMWPNAKHPEGRARRIYEKARANGDLGRLLETFGPDIRKIFKVLDDALDANYTFATKSGEVVTVPDHRIRLSAVKMTTDIIQRSEPQVVQHNVNVEIEQAKREARAFKKTATPEELEAERLRLLEEYNKQQDTESAGTDDSSPPDPD